jgi:hypothetical protein
MDRLPLFYVSVSGLVVIVDLLVCPAPVAGKDHKWLADVQRTNKKDMHSKETEQKITEVKGALDVMRQIADISHPSRAAVKVMDFLLGKFLRRSMICMYLSFELNRQPK